MQDEPEPPKKLEPTPLQNTKEAEKEDAQWEEIHRLLNSVRQQHDKNKNMLWCLPFIGKKH